MLITLTLLLKPQKRRPQIANRTRGAHKLTANQRKALKFATTPVTTIALNALEMFIVGHLELYVDSGRRYLQAYKGAGKCHLRALSNVCGAAAKEVHEAKIGHRETDRIHEVLEKHDGAATGKVFHINKRHWVALERGNGEKNAMYYDDAVMLEIDNFEGAAAALQLAQDMTTAAYDKLMHGKPASKKTTAAQNKFKEMAAKQKAVAVCITRRRSNVIVVH